jgi:ribosomal protein S18 acetylase RimI-like enzyme
MMPIRPLTKNDRDAVYKMLSQLSKVDPEEKRTAMAMIDAALQAPDEEYSVLCAHLHQGDLLGFICFGPDPLSEDCYNLYWIMVDRKFGRRGIGSELMLSMEERLLRKNARRIYINISSAPQYEAVRLFYEKYGFLVDSILDDYYRSGVDKIMYRKEI